MTRRSILAAILAVCPLASLPAQDRTSNPNGWIRTSGWNFLLSLPHSWGCYAGGEENMRKNWLAPHRIELEDPQAGENWDSISGEPFTSEGFSFGGISPIPLWVSNAFLEDYFATPPFPDGDLVDMGALVDHLNTYVIPKLESGSPVPKENVLGVATTYVQNTSGAPLWVDVCAGSDDSIQVWVNDRLIINSSACRGTALGCAELRPAVLPAGTSKITVLIWDGVPPWSFRLGLRRRSDGVHYRDSDDAGILFLGAFSDLPGQLQYGLTRKAEVKPFDCPNDTLTVRLIGDGTGALGETLYLTEDILAGVPAHLSVSGVTGGGVVSDKYSPTPPAEAPVGSFATSGMIGNPCGSSNGTLNDLGVYTSIAQTGQDIWDCGDVFEFGFSRIAGDFDIAIKVLDSTHSNHLGRWGKFGLMARQSLATDSRYTMIQDHLPDLTDPRRVAGRTIHEVGCAGMYDSDVFTGDPAVSPHPLYLRLTRRGNVVQGWASDAPEVEGDPATDSHWASGFADDWGAAAPSKVYVGFANSVHFSSGCAEQRIYFKLLNFSGTTTTLYDAPVKIGKTIAWPIVARDTVNSGLSYQLRYADRGWVDLIGTASLTSANGDRRIFYDTTQTGPIGDFENSHDIGNPPSRGSTTLAAGVYSMTSSGIDIWQNGDQFRFAYREVTGDFLMEARVRSRSPPASGGRWGKHGLMARWSCDDDSYYSMVQTNLASAGQPLDEPRVAVRPVDRSLPGHLATTYESFVVPDGLLGLDPRSGNERLPSWMRMLRRGRSISYFLSRDDGGGKPAKWCFVGSESNAAMPATILAGMALCADAAGASGSITVDNFRWRNLGRRGVDLEPLAYETASSGAGGMGSTPYAPLLVTAQVTATVAQAVALGGSGLALKNQPYLWRDLTVGGENLAGTEQVLWNLENATFSGAHLRLTFSDECRVYIAWDSRHVKGGSRNPLGTVNNGWFDFNNALNTTNAQGWRRIGDSIAVHPAADVIKTDAPAGGVFGGFAQGGLWCKDVAPGESLDFLATGFTTAETPYVVFIRSSACSTLEVLKSFDFTGANGSAPAGGVVVQGGPFRPVIQGGRLRLSSEAAADSGNAVWFPIPASGAGGAPLAAEGFTAEFDAFMTRAGVRVNPDSNPGEGMTFAVIQGSAGDAFLHLSDLRGDTGPALGYEGGTLRQRAVCHPSFAIELDTRVAAGPWDAEVEDGGSPLFDGNYHVGLDVNGSVNSIQTHRDLGIAAASSLPDIFKATGVHVEVQYRPDGLVEVWLKANDGSVPRTRVISEIIPALEGDLVLGFTAATGSDVALGSFTSTIEVDNLQVKGSCCQRPRTLTISGPPPDLGGVVRVEVGQPITLTALLQDPVHGSTPTYAWQLITGTATLGPVSSASLDLTGTLAGDARLRVTVDDGGGCAALTSAEFPLKFFCPTSGDTHATGLTVTPPSGPAGTFLAAATATDDSGQSIRYTFSASNGINPPQVKGPQAGASASFILTPGTWTVSVFADDTAGCADEAADARRSKIVVVSSAPVPCALVLSSSIKPGTRTASLTLSKGGPAGCACDLVVVWRDGREVYRGPFWSGGKDFPLTPASDPGATIQFEAACSSGGVDGTRSSSSVISPDEGGEAILLKTLQLGVPSSTTLSSTLRRVWYRLDAPEAKGKAVSIILTDADASDVNALYLRWGALALPSAFDQAAEGLGGSSQSLFVPYFEAGTLYILVQANGLHGGSNLTTVLASVVDLAIEGISPAAVGRGGSGARSASIRGVGFAPATQFTLIHRGSGARFPTAKRELVSAQLADVSFDITSAPVGEFDLEARDSATRLATRPRVFEILDTQTGPSLTVTLLAPARVRVSAPSILDLVYTNSGDQEMVAPLLEIVGPPNSEFRLVSEETFHRERIQLLAVGSAGAAGILLPGGSGKIPIVARLPGPGSVRLQVFRLTPGAGDLVGWSSLPAPPGVPAADWTALRAALPTRLGTTWLQYGENLASRATRLARRGVDGASALESFRFAAREAYGRATSALVGTLRDGTTGEPIAGGTVLALESNNVKSFAKAGVGGSWAIDWLEPGKTYTLRIVDRSGVRTVAAPAAGDLLGIDLIGGSQGTGPAPVCPNCNLASLPQETIAPPARLLVLAAIRDLHSVAAIDPNSKDGPDGEGVEHLVGPGQDFLYSIHCDNVGSAPALQVIVTDTLGRDLRWVRPDHVVINGGPQPIIATFSSEGTPGAPSSGAGATLAGAGAAGGWFVSSRCDFNPLTKRLVWTLTTIDPQTGAYPADLSVEAGFLPLRGSVEVGFIAQALESTPEGDLIENEAEIIFDAAPPVRTNVVRNKFHRAGMPFTRGDANGDGSVDISDSIFSLSNQFLGDTAPPCRESADFNDDDKVDVTDPIYLLNHLFWAGTPPPPPYRPPCGLDPTPDGIGCLASPACVP